MDFLQLTEKSIKSLNIAEKKSNRQFTTGSNLVTLIMPEQIKFQEGMVYEESLKIDFLEKLISEEVKNVLMEYQNLDDIKLNAALQKKLDLFVKEIEGTPNLTKLKVAAILNDVIEALGLNKVQITSYMNMLKQYKTKEASKKDKKSDIQDV